MRTPRWEPCKVACACSNIRLVPFLVLVFSFLCVLHAPLLGLPYFWDEAGYFVPAARDLLLTGDPIPWSRPSNAHPPFVMAYLAVWWKLFGFTPAVARTAMLLMPAFALLGVFRLSAGIANWQVATASTICTAVYPVFFAQSSLTQLDLPAAALSIWGLALYLEGRLWSCGILLSLAALAKETAVVTPVALLIWELSWKVLGQRRWLVVPGRQDVLRRGTSAAILLLPIVVLGLWFAYHYARTGFVFGNPEFFRYNVATTLRPLRVAVAILLRLWHATFHMNLFVLTVPAAAVALMCLPLRDRAEERRGVALNTQLLLATVILAYIVTFSLVGGAVVARYMLPVVPLVIVLCVCTLWRRMRHWRIVVGATVVAFVIGLFVNPPHHYSLDENLAYRDFVLLHRGAADFVLEHYPNSRVLTAWPATDELTEPYLGYVSRAVRVVGIKDFSPQSMTAAARDNSAFDVALVFPTRYEPRESLFRPGRYLRMLPFWQRAQTRFFDPRQELSPEVAAQVLGGRVVWQETRGEQYVAVVQIEHGQTSTKPIASD